MLVTVSTVFLSMFHCWHCHKHLLYYYKSSTNCHPKIKWYIPFTSSLPRITYNQITNDLLPSSTVAQLVEHVTKIQESWVWIPLRWNISFFSSCGPHFLTRALMLSGKKIGFLPELIQFRFLCHQHEITMYTPHRKGFCFDPPPPRKFQNSFILCF